MLELHPLVAFFYVGLAAGVASVITVEEKRCWFMGRFSLLSADLWLALFLSVWPLFLVLGFARALFGRRG